MLIVLNISFLENLQFLIIVVVGMVLAVQVELVLLLCVRQIIILGILELMVRALAPILARFLLNNILMVKPVELWMGGLQVFFFKIRVHI